MNKENLHQFYQAKIDAIKVVLRGLKQRSLSMLYGKLSAFFAGAAIIYLYYGHYDWSFTGLLVLSVLTYIGCFIYDERLKRKIAYNLRKKEICENEQAFLKGDFSAFDDGEKFINSHHEYTYDLDVFGHHSLYQRMNRTITDAGGDCLADKFKSIPSNEKQILDNQNAIKELAGKPDFRLDFLACGPIHCRFDQLERKALQPFHFFYTGSYRIVYLILFLTALSVVLLPLTSWAGTALGILFVVQNILTISKIKPIKVSIHQIEKLHDKIGGYLTLLKCIRNTTFESPRLKELKIQLFYQDNDCFEALRKMKKIISLFNQRNGMVGYALFNGFMLSDVRAVRQFIRWIARYGDKLEMWNQSIAELDALITLATYCYNHPENVKPDFLDEESSALMEIKSFYHPFLSEGKAVPNDFTLLKNNIYIITGANMAGKSTFLRTVGVNYLLAVTGATVCAKSFRFSLVSLFSSMRTSDDLSENISYFNAELLRLEQLISYCKGKKHTLIILDEILKGTNSKDKLQGSILFLQKIQALPVTVLVATHDLELAKLGEQSKQFHNYSFEIELGKDITYTYKIGTGVARNLNATYLLKGLLDKISEEN